MHDRPARSVGLDGGTYKRAIYPWPYSGTGLTADPEMGVPERWRRYDRLPGGSVIHEYHRDGTRKSVAVYQGEAFGWWSL